MKLFLVASFCGIWHLDELTTRGIVAAFAVSVIVTFDILTRDAGLLTPSALVRVRTSVWVISQVLVAGVAGFRVCSFVLEPVPQISGRAKRWRGSGKPTAY